MAAILLLVALETTGTTNFFTSNDTDTQEVTEESFDIPPTEEEANAGDEAPIKQEPLEDNSQEPNNSGADQDDDSQSTPVSVVISNIGVYDGMIEVSAFTPDAIANGTCTYVFTSGANTVTKTTRARADASSSICIDEPFPVSELSASDEWGVGVTYKSESGNYIGTQQTVLQL